jgi:hypothetical protein
MLNFKELRERRKQLEGDLAKLVSEFEEETGVTCDGIECTRHPMYKHTALGDSVAGSSYPEFNVEIRV